jgi:hypothetical protein
LGEFGRKRVIEGCSEYVQFSKDVILSKLTFYRAIG